MRAQVQPGAAFLKTSGPSHDPNRKHLFIVVSQLRDGKVLLVSISSCRKGCDTACILNVRDHQFITHQSFVAYHRTHSMNATELYDKLNSGEYQQQDSVGHRVLARILTGFKKTKSAPPLAYQYIPKQYKRK